MSSVLRQWYRQPAEADWNRALPIGSGRLGAMVFGNVVRERVQLNEDSLWNGGARDRTNPSARGSLAEIRRLLFQGQLARAHALVNDALAGIPDSQRCYEPLGDLLFHFDHAGALPRVDPSQLAVAEGKASTRFDPDVLAEYRRELDLRNAVAKVEYTLGGCRFSRRYLASAIDGVIAIRLEADQPGAISFRLRLERGPRESYSTRYADRIERCGADGRGDGLLMTGRAGGEDGVRFAACLRARNEGGQLRVIGETLLAEEVDAVTLVLAASTSFRETEPAQNALETSACALERGWEKILADHEREYRQYFDRVDLQLGSTSTGLDADALPTDERLIRHDQRHDDPALEALYFHFGRYLLISSSRPGSLPANLQGVWSQEFWPSWGSKYTININTEMNYWVAEVGNLAECHQPLFALIERLAETGRVPAREMYGCDGFMAHHNTDVWADPFPTDRNLGASYWFMGGAWLALHLWEHFAFGGDRDFLARVYPVLREASRFFLDFLIEDSTGRLVVSPTCSPENTYRLPSGEGGVLCAGSQMDSQILDTLFRRTDEAARILGLDAELRAELESARCRLPPLAIGADGRLLEWLEPHEELEPRHRHVSHLFALYPGDGIDGSRDPALAEAARASLEARGDEGTGWSMAWKINFWARLQDGARACRLLRNLLKPAPPTPENKALIYDGEGGTYPNLFCAHPPFQIDGNFGGAAAIAEMLLQSHRQVQSAAAGLIYEICLLPALPPQWASGLVRGWRARGGFEVDFAWADGLLTHAELSSTHGGTCQLRCGERAREITLPAGARMALDHKFEQVAR